MTNTEFQKILSENPRVAIIGGPQVGKTTLANTVTDRPVYHNDQGKHVPWEDQPQYWKDVTAGQSSFVIEGVQAVRAVRKGLDVDAVIYLDKPHVELTPGQQNMHKGQKTIFDDMISQRPELKVYR